VRTYAGERRACLEQQMGRIVLIAGCAAQLVGSPNSIGRV
jgi:hypothetical protein